MKFFKSWHAYSTFSIIVKKESRFNYNEDVKEFLSAVKETSKKRQKPIKAESELWRAQLGCVTENRPCQDDKTDTYEHYVPYSKERMFPIAGKSRAGRITPSGITCLYLSDERDTALAEVRPWLGANISIARFEVVRDLKIVDCTKDATNFVPLKYLKQKENEQYVWSDINKAFSSPISPNEIDIEYVPTQIIAEVFKYAGYDGVVYKSSYDEKGKNIALFDLKSVKILNRFLYQLKKINFDFKESF